MGKAAKEKNQIWSDRAGCWVQICFQCEAEGRGRHPFQSDRSSPIGRSFCENPECPKALSPSSEALVVERTAEETGQIWSSRLSRYVQICYTCQQDGRGFFPFIAKSMSPTGHSFCENATCPRGFRNKAETAIRKGYRDAHRWANLDDPDQVRLRSRSRRAKRNLGTAFERGITRDTDRELLEGRRPPRDDRDYRILRTQEVLRSEAGYIRGTGDRPASSRARPEEVRRSDPVLLRERPRRERSRSRRSRSRPGGRVPWADAESRRARKAGRSPMPRQPPPTKQPIPGADDVAPPGPQPGMSPEEREKAEKELAQWTRSRRYRQREQERAGVPPELIPAPAKAAPHLGWAADVPRPPPAKAAAAPRRDPPTATKSSPPKAGAQEEEEESIEDDVDDDEVKAICAQFDKEQAERQALMSTGGSWRLLEKPKTEEEVGDDDMNLETRSEVDTKDELKDEVKSEDETVVTPPLAPPSIKAFIAAAEVAEGPEPFPVAPLVGKAPMPTTPKARSAAVEQSSSTSTSDLSDSAFQRRLTNVQEAVLPEQDMNRPVPKPSRPSIAASAAQRERVRNVLARLRETHEKAAPSKPTDPFFRKKP
jgi:hypothetical protein